MSKIPPVVTNYENIITFVRPFLAAKKLNFMHIYMFCCKITKRVNN